VLRLGRRADHEPGNQKPGENPWPWCHSDDSDHYHPLHFGHRGCRRLGRNWRHRTWCRKPSQSGINFCCTIRPGARPDSHLYVDRHPASSFASLQTTMISPSRTILAMGYYKALPPQFSNISPKYRTPSVATLASAIGTGAFYTVTRLISENALWDTITAL